MMLRGHICSLRAVEPEDLELLCRWENDPSLWTVSGTIEPFSHYSIEQFIQEQQAGIYRCGQLRLMIDDTAGETIGAIDLFDFEPQHERAGVGILVYDPAQRGKGYGAEALALLEEYARTVLRLRQLWCNVLKRSGSVPPKGIRTKYCSKSCFRQFEIQICRNFPAR